MNFAKRFIALLFLCACGLASAQTFPPVDGIYWDSHQGGRGYAVETQDDLMFIAIYNYDTDDSTAFYFIQGYWNGASRRVDNAHLLQVSSGPWIGGPFSPIGTVVDKGAVTFEFPSFTTARFVYNGQTSNLQRFVYNYGSNADSLMSGTWYATFGGSGVYFGELIGVFGTCTIAECDSIPEAFYGARIDGGSDRVLVGGRQDDGRVFFLLDSSTSYYELFVYELRVNEWVGFSAVFLKTEDFPDSGLVMFGHRLTGPSDMPTAMPTGDIQDIVGIDAMKAQATARAAPARIEGKAVRSDDIRTLMPALKQAIQHLH
jgi:hypothetical protein